MAKFINGVTRRKVLEEGTLFISVLKWSVIATVIGLLVGISTSIFLLLLGSLSIIISEIKFYYFALPVVFVFSALIVKYLAPEAEGHGTEKVIEAIHERSGKISILVIPVKLITSIMTIAFGGSAGKEGPCAQIGAGISSTVASIFRMSDDDRKKIVICGISAGFASVFGTPIAGALFGIEVLFIGQMLYEVLLPSFVSGFTAYYVASSMGIKYLHNTISVVPQFSEKVFWDTVLSGIFFGIVSLILIEMMQSISRFFKKQFWTLFRKAMVGGIILAGIGLLISPDYLGLGVSGIEKMLKGENYPGYSFLLKSFTTSITLSTGGSGGIITPIFFIGASAGNFFSRFISVDPVTFSALGMVSVLSGCANTPISASILAIELFGANIGPYAALSSIVSFIMSGHRSVFPSQKIGIRKSASIKVRLMEEVEDIQSVEIEMRKGGVLKTIVALIEYFKLLLIRIKEYFRK